MMTEYSTNKIRPSEFHQICVPSYTTATSSELLSNPTESYLMSNGMSGPAAQSSSAPGVVINQYNTYAEMVTTAINNSTTDSSLFTNFYHPQQHHQQVDYQFMPSSTSNHGFMVSPAATGYSYLAPTQPNWKSSPTPMTMTASYMLAHEDTNTTCSSIASGSSSSSSSSTSSSSGSSTPTTLSAATNHQLIKTTESNTALLTTLTDTNLNLNHHQHHQHKSDVVNNKSALSSKSSNRSKHHQQQLKEEFQFCENDIVNTNNNKFGDVNSRAKVSNNNRLGKLPNKHK